MIILYVGNVGAGKTLQAVREMVKTPWITYYTNIQTKGLPNVHPLTYDMIIKREATGAVSRGKPVYEYKLNTEFWEKLPKPVSIVIDEIHNILSARSSMSHVNKIALKWISLLRRMTGQNESGYGNLICITQLGRASDVVLRQMCHRVVYIRQYYTKVCRDCGFRHNENSDMPQQMEICYKCKSTPPHIGKDSSYSVLFKFTSVEALDIWKQLGIRSYYCMPKKIFHSERYFKYYDHLQMKDMFSDF